MDVFQPVDGSPPRSLAPCPFPPAPFPCEPSLRSCTLCPPLFMHSLRSCVRNLTPRISAIMRGAVLYKLGLDFVKDRIIRKSYGVAMNVAFRPGHHPNSRKVTSLDGVVRCEDVMHWYAYKVRSREPVVCVCVCIPRVPCVPCVRCVSPVCSKGVFSRG